jgi:TPR repeat protein
MQRTAWTILAVVAIGLGAAATAAAQPSPQLRYANSVSAAAARGDVGAQTRLGYMYERGIGVAQDYEMAAMWYNLAAEQGDPRAQHHLGLLFNKGFGVPVDFMTAYKWLNLAASRVGNVDRPYYVRMRDAVGSKLSHKEVAEAQLWATLWQPKRLR